MQCIRCNSDDVVVQLVADHTENVVKHVGLLGHMANSFRFLLALSTLGLSNFFWPKAKEKKHEVTDYKVVAVCQDCGKTWEVDDR